MLWSCIDDLKCPWFSSWVEIKTPAMKIYSGLVVVSIPIAAGKSFHLFDLTVEAFAQGIGYPVSGIG